LVVSGRSGELARIVAGAVTRLADGPAKINNVGAHVHLDPTSDLEGAYYAPGSGSLVIIFEPDS
jgi:hypothetical protein